MRQAPIEAPIRVRSRGADGSQAPNSHCSSYGDDRSVNFDLFIAEIRGVGIRIRSFVSTKAALSAVVVYTFASLLGVASLLAIALRRADALNDSDLNLFELQLLARVNVTRRASEAFRPTRKSW
jgi:hypothetical protein